MKSSSLKNSQSQVIRLLYLAFIDKQIIKPGTQPKLRKSADQGFALPTILGLGLVILMIAIYTFARSTSDRVAAIAQVQNAQSVGVAEAGIARTLAGMSTLNTSYLFTRNYDDPSILGPDQVQYSGDEAASNTWATATPVIGGCSYTPPSLPVPVSGTTTEGTYQVLAYRFTPNVSNSSPGTGGVGSLLVQGNVNAGTNIQRQARLQVNIPITRTTRLNSFPGLYGRDSVSLGNNDVGNGTGGTTANSSGVANVICENCTVPSGQCTNGQPNQSAVESVVNKGPNSEIAGNIYLGSANLPAPPTPPTPDCPVSGTFSAPCKITIANITSTTTLPRPSDPDPTNNSIPYQYVITGNISLSGNSSNRLTAITSTDVNHNPPGSRIVLFVGGNISFSGQANITHSGSPERLAIIGTGGTSQTFTLNGGSSGNNAFVYIADGTVGVNGGSGGPNGCDFRGAVWARVWDGSSGTNAKVCIPDDMPTLLENVFGSSYGIMAAGIQRYIAGAPLAWQGQEVR